MEQLAQFVRFLDIADYYDLHDRVEKRTGNPIKNTLKDEAEVANIGTGECFGCGKHRHEIKDCWTMANRKGQTGKGGKRDKKALDTKVPEKGTKRIP